MSWAVEWTPPARRDMTRLAAKIAGAVMTYVDERLAQNPARLSKPLSGEFEGLRSARNGDYRVMFELDDEASVIVVAHVHHRAHLYRSR